MRAQNHSVIEACCAWLQSGHALWLVTVLETYGASPRPVGSLCAYNAQDNMVVGSLSGGCIEEDLFRELQGKQAGLSTLQNTAAQPPPFQKIYGVSQSERDRFELPCGGRLRLLIEYIAPDTLALTHFAHLHRRLQIRQRVERRVDYQTGLLASSESISCSKLTEFTGHFRHPLGPAYRMLIIGAGEVTRYLIPLVESIDMQVAVCEPRQSFIQRSAVGGTMELIQALPDDVVTAQYRDRYSAIVALAHDPRVDDLALLAALETEAFYVGAMGSKRTSMSRVRRLKDLGVSAAQLERLHAPIGIALDSKTPPEIAISIVAQVVQARNEQRRAEAASLDSMAMQSQG